MILNVTVDRQNITVGKIIDAHFMVACDWITHNSEQWLTWLPTVQYNLEEAAILGNIKQGMTKVKELKFRRS